MIKKLILKIKRKLNMSAIKLELTEDHIKLLKQLRWSLKDNVVSGVGDDGVQEIPPFGEDNIYEGIDVILNGRPDDFDPINNYEIKEYSKEQKDKWDKLYSELPIALDLILFNGSFELGKYKSKWHDRFWKKIK